MSLDSRYNRSDVDDSNDGMLADVTSVLAGSLLVMTALFDILQGLSAIAKDHVYAVGTDYLYRFDTTTWGWLHLIIGVLALAVAIGILVHASWGQVTGLIVAGLVMLTNFAFLPYYPFWSIIVITFSALVMWALCTQLKRN
jgi:hypothetical protein